MCSITLCNLCPFCISFFKKKKKKSDLKYIQANLKKKSITIDSFNIRFQSSATCSVPFPLCHTWKRASLQYDNYLVKPTDIFEKPFLQMGMRSSASACAWITNRSTSCAKQSRRTRWQSRQAERMRVFFLVYWRSCVWYCRWGKQSVCKKNLLCLAVEGKVHGWGNQDSPLVCIERTMFWEEHASLQPLGTCLAMVNCSHVSSPTTSLTHFHSMLPYSIPVSSRYSCVSNVIASFTFPTAEPITFLTFPHFPLICITDMFVF